MIITGASLLVLSITLGLTFGLKKDKGENGEDEDNGNNEDTPTPIPTEEVPVVDEGGGQVSAENISLGSFPIRHGSKGRNVAQLQVALNKKLDALSSQERGKLAIELMCLDFDDINKLSVDGKMGSKSLKLYTAFYPNSGCCTSWLWSCQCKDCKIETNDWNIVLSGLTFTSAENQQVENAVRDLDRDALSFANGFDGHFSVNGDYKEHRFAFGGQSETRENLAGWKDSEYQSEFWMNK